jgi:hypothetical protein
MFQVILKINSYFFENNTDLLVFQLIYQSTYALNKIQSNISMKLLHVSAPGRHNQGVIQDNGVQTQHANLGNASSVLEWLRY